MKLPISQRLLACCELVTPGSRVADIGCDHGYLGIYLLLKGLSPFVYAADVRPGPLEAAIRNGEKYSVGEKMQFFLSDGVRAVPRDFDTLVCAGMGADVMVSILSAAPWLQSVQYRLILQCQSKTPVLRKYLSETGWRIAKERVLKDGRFLYTVMEAVWDPGHALSPGQCFVSPALLQSGCPLLPDYISWVKEHLALGVHNQKDKADPFAVSALQELEAL